MRIVSKALNITRKGLDDDYTLFENGEILHEYDKSRYPGGYNLKKKLTVNEIDEVIKRKLYDEASDEDKELAKRLLKLQ